MTTKPCYWEKTFIIHWMKVKSYLVIMIHAPQSLWCCSDKLDASSHSLCIALRILRNWNITATQHSMQPLIVPLDCFDRRGGNESNVSNQSIKSTKSVVSKLAFGTQKFECDVFLFPITLKIQRKPLQSSFNFAPRKASYSIKKMRLWPKSNPLTHKTQASVSKKTRL